MYGFLTHEYVLIDNHVRKCEKPDSALCIAHILVALSLDVQDMQNRTLSILENGGYMKNCWRIPISLNAKSDFPHNSIATHQMKG